MIDINKLRRLAQSATPGHWQFWHGWVAADIDNDGGVIIVERPTPSGGKHQARVDNNFKFIAAANPATINELLDRLEAAESECLEEARLNGMGSEREAALMAKLESAKKERDALRAELAQLHKEADKFGNGIDWIQRSLQAEAKVEQMEWQEPVAWMLNCPTLGGDTGWILSWTQSGAGLCNRLQGEKNEKRLYALPGAQPAPSVPDGCWKQAVEEIADEGFGAVFKRLISDRAAMLAAAPEAKP